MAHEAWTDGARAVWMVFDRLCWSSNCLWLARPEGDDAAYGIVRRDAYGDAIPWHYLDTKAAHPAAQLCQHFVARVALDPVEPSTVHCHHGALHVNQVVLAQKLAFPAFLKSSCRLVANERAVFAQKSRICCPDGSLTRTSINNCATLRAIPQIQSRRTASSTFPASAP
jgi:hypothetical protein